LGAVPVAEQLKAPFLASAAGDDAILKGSPKWIWRGSSVATTEAGSLIAKYVGDTYSPKKVVVIKDKTTAYTEAEAKSIVDTLESQGATVDSSQSVEEGQSNFLAQTSAIKKVAPDVIVLTGYPAVTAPLTRQIRQSGIKAPIVSDQVAVGDDFLQLAGDEGKGVVGFWSSGPYFTDDDPQMKAWLAAFTKKFPNAGKGYPNFLTVWAYADTYALLDAMRRAGSTDASAVQKALNSTDAYLNGPDTELGGIPIGLPRTWTADEHDGTHELRAYEVSGGKWVPVS
jgi:branched-chain amino acid transport system substrate-binding protein